MSLRDRRPPVTVCEVDWTPVAPKRHVTVRIGVGYGPAIRWPTVLTAGYRRLLPVKRKGGNDVATASVGLLIAEGVADPRRRSSLSARTS